MKARVANGKDWEFLNRDGRYGDRRWFSVVSINGSYIELDELGWFYYKQVEVSQ